MSNSPDDVTAGLSLNDKDVATIYNVDSWSNQDSDIEEFEE